MTIFLTGECVYIRIHHIPFQTSEFHFTFKSVCLSSGHCIGDRWRGSTGQGHTDWIRLAPCPFLCANQLRTALYDVPRSAVVSYHIFLRRDALTGECIWNGWERTTGSVLTIREARAPLAVGFTADFRNSMKLEAFEALNLDCPSAAKICPIDSSVLNHRRGTTARQAGRRAATPGAIGETPS